MGTTDVGGSVGVGVGVGREVTGVELGAGNVVVTENVGFGVDDDGVGDVLGVGVAVGVGAGALPLALISCLFGSPRRALPAR